MQRYANTEESSVPASGFRWLTEQVPRRWRTAEGRLRQWHRQMQSGGKQNSVMCKLQDDGLGSKAPGSDEGEEKEALSRITSTAECQA